MPTSPPSSQQTPVPDIIAKYGGKQKFDVLHKPLLPPLYFANENASIEEVRQAFQMIDKDNSGRLDTKEVEQFLRESGFGDSECEAFFRRADTNRDGQIEFEEFHRGWGFISALEIRNRQKSEDIMRKPGSFQPGATAIIAHCSDCEIALCDITCAAEAVGCHGCRVVIGPCKGTVLVKDSKSCSFSIASQQLRIRNCIDCKFFLYSRSEPIIEACREVWIGSWNVVYPGLTPQFDSLDWDGSANLWYAVFNVDQRAEEMQLKKGGRPHWHEIKRDRADVWQIEISDSSEKPSNPVPPHARGELPEDCLGGKRRSPVKSNTGSPPKQIPPHKQKSSMCVLL